MKTNNPECMNYIFIPGKNWRLSLAELLAFSEAQESKLEIASLSKSFFVIANKTPLEPAIVNDLGGTIKIGKVVSQFPSQILENAFIRGNNQAKKELGELLSSSQTSERIFGALSLKRVFGVSLYFRDARFLRFSRRIHRFVGSYFKRELATGGAKTAFMGFPQDRKMPQLTHVEVIKKKLLEESAEILFCIDKEQAVVAKTIAIHNPFKFQERDVNRPIQRKIFSMPPRLARIMINLSLCTAGKTLLDPFCGVGTILQEALLTRAKVIGVDVDSWCVNGSRQNLEWLRTEYGLKNAEYTVFLGNSHNLTREIKSDTIDCIATEPDLGPPLRYIPTMNFAARIVEKLKPSYRGFLKEAYRMLRNKGRLVIVTPFIKTRNGKFAVFNIEGMAHEIGFVVIHPLKREAFAINGPFIEELVNASSLVDIGERHKTGRAINILEKQV